MVLVKGGAKVLSRLLRSETCYVILILMNAALFPYSGFTNLFTRLKAFVHFSTLWGFIIKTFFDCLILIYDDPSRCITPDFVCARKYYWNVSRMVCFIYPVLMCFIDIAAHSINQLIVPRTISIYIRLLVSFLVSERFLYYAVILAASYKKLNAQLQDTKHLTPVDTISVVRQCQILDHTLKELAESVNITFGTSNLSLALCSFVEITYSIVFYYIDAVDVWDHVISFFWIFVMVVQLFVLVLGSDLATSEAARTTVYLHELFVETDYPDVKYEVEIFSLQLIHRKIQFDACGFFKLDFTLLYSMVGAVTTYIIILVQFQTSQDIRCKLDCTSCPSSDG